MTKGPLAAPSAPGAFLYPNPLVKGHIVKSTTVPRQARTYSARETAEIIGVPYSTLTEMVREGRVDHLRPIRVGRQTRFPKVHIDRLTEGTAA